MGGIAVGGSSSPRQVRMAVYGVLVTHAKVILKLREAAQSNTIENFRFVFEHALEGLFIDRRDQNEELFGRYTNDPEFQKTVQEYLLRSVFKQIREEGEGNHN